MAASKSGPKKPAHIPTALKVLSGGCGVALTAYYYLTGQTIGIAVGSGILGAWLAYLAICALYGMVGGSVEAAVQKDHPDAENYRVWLPLNHQHPHRRQRRPKLSGSPKVEAS